MMQELQPLIQLLSGHFGWVATLVTIIGVIRLPMKFISARMQTAMTRKMAEEAASNDADGQAMFDALLQRKWYRVGAFMLDLVCSFKLPTHADFSRLLTENKNQTSTSVQTKENNEK